jgi:hypothetical protein
MVKAQLCADSEIEHSIAAKRDAIIEWLSPLNFFIRQQDISETRQPGTGEWLLDDLKFQDWKSNSGGVLWCSGIRM